MSARRRKIRVRTDREAQRSFAQSLLAGPARWASLALIVLNVAIYAPVAHHEFVTWDDPQYIINNPHISHGLTWQDISWALSSGYASNWHPLTWWSHMLDVQLFGLNAGPHHLTNMLLHIANTLLLLAVLHQMTGALGRSAFVAALFAVHPLHVESVAWIAERKDVLSTLFWMLTLLAYVRYVRQPRVTRYLAVFALLALGLMAKPMLVTLPFVLLLLDVWPLKRIGPQTDATEVVRLLREKLPLLVLAGASGLITVLVQRKGGAVAPVDALPLTFRLQNALVSYVAYVGKMLWPVHLAAVYPYPRSIPTAWVAASAIALIAASVAALRAARRRPYLAVGWFWYLGTLVPVIGLVQVGSQAMADRYTYIPLVGLFLVVAWGVPDLLDRWPAGRRALPIAAAFVILGCLVTARVQVQYWRDSQALWQHAVDVTTDNFIAQDGLGVAFATQGRGKEAIAHFAEAVRANPNYPYAHNNLGIELRKQRRLEEAVVQEAEAVRLKPDFAEGHNSLGNALADEGRLDEAVSHYAEAVRLKPDYIDAHRDLAVALGKLGRFEESAMHFAEVVRLQPGSANARINLAIALASQGRFKDAAAEATEALRLEPGNQTARVLLNRLSAGP
jgi:Flp pilus assembly protein TadD